MEGDKYVKITSVRNVYYRTFACEPSMVVVFDESDGRQLGNYDKEAFEKTIINKIGLTGDVVISEFEEKK